MPARRHETLPHRKGRCVPHNQQFCLAEDRGLFAATLRGDPWFCLGELSNRHRGLRKEASGEGKEAQSSAKAKSAVWELKGKKQAEWSLGDRDRNGRVRSRGVLQ